MTWVCVWICLRQENIILAKRLYYDEFSFRSLCHFCSVEIFTPAWISSVPWVLSFTYSLTRCFTCNRLPTDMEKNLQWWTLNVSANWIKPYQFPFVFIANLTFWFVFLQTSTEPLCFNGILHNWPLAHWAAHTWVWLTAPRHSPWLWLVVSFQTYLIHPDGSSCFVFFLFDFFQIIFRYTHNIVSFNKYEKKVTYCSHRALFQ